MYMQIKRFRQIACILLFLHNLRKLKIEDHRRYNDFK